MLTFRSLVPLTLVLAIGALGALTVAWHMSPPATSRTPPVGSPRGAPPPASAAFRAPLVSPPAPAADSTSPRVALPGEHDHRAWRAVLVELAEGDPATFHELALTRAADPRAGTGLLLALLEELERFPEGDRLDLLTEIALAQKTEARRLDLEGDPDPRDLLQRQTLAHGAARELARRLTPAELDVRLRSAARAQLALLIGLALDTELPLPNPAALAAQLSQDAGELAAAATVDPVHTQLANREVEDRLEVLAALPAQAKAPALLDLLAQGALTPALAEQAVSALPLEGLAEGALARLTPAGPSGRVALSRILLDPSRGDPASAPAAVDALHTVAANTALPLETRSGALEVLEHSAHTSSAAQRALVRLAELDDTWLRARVSEHP